MKSILVFCAHPDDEVFGVGGTAAKYSKEGYKIIPVIFSFGESSHPWLLKRYIVKARVKECKKAGKIIGYEDPVFLGLKDTKVRKEIQQKKVILRLKEMVKRDEPEMIFTHSINDPHPDHRAIYWATLEAVKNIKVPVYSYDIWNPISLVKRDAPKLYVDISQTFRLKIAALKLFKSQTTSIVSLLWSVYTRAFINGWNSDCKYAEKFTKVN